MAKTQARRCTAHRTRDGQPCEAWAVHGATVCRAHGGAAPQVRAAATERLAVEAAHRLALPVKTTGSEALQDGLDRFNGQVGFLAEQLSAVPEEQLIWGVVQRRIKQPSAPGGTPQIEVTQAERRHPYWAAYDDAIARRGAVAAEMRKLGIEERRQAVLERDGAAMVALFEGALREFAEMWRWTARQQAEARAVMARRFREQAAIESGEHSR